MDSLASPQDLLLAYNEDFTGYTSLGSMSQPLEHRGRALRPEASVLGGTETSDGYYEDFTASLARFVKDYPRLATTPQARPKTGGTAAATLQATSLAGVKDMSAPRPLNWGAMIITFSVPCDSDDEHGDDERGDDERGDDERGDDERGDDDERVDDERVDDERVDMTGGAHHRAPLVSLGDFIVDGEYLGGLGDEISAEMDETDVETDPFERFHFGRAPAADGSDPMDRSILGFVSDK
jgi:hypothetical protein